MTNNHFQRLRLYNVILNNILERELHDYDNFSMKLTDHIMRNFKKGCYDVRKIIDEVKTNFFRLNKIKRSDLFSGTLEREILKTWQYKGIKGLPTSGKPLKITHQVVVKQQRGKYAQVYVDEIDSFAEAKNVQPKQVRGLIPLDIKEERIKLSLAEIVGEVFTQKDWGGEKSDLFTSRVTFKGRRTPSAFLLKGSGTKGILTIKKCGKNGDQLIRLLEEPARIYFVQHVDAVHTNLIRMFETLVADKSRMGRKLYYCVMDGVDTARVLTAYGKI